ncbi:hypothetical protein LIER_43279 [Lithospermum erythrorhizon]|uniref:Uncharacterized protein n=1 Tax=Lithospermum erythrorhizon TaxID=34254 RepID=A0AAV3PTN2_LITER
MFEGKLKDTGTGIRQQGRSISKVDIERKDGEAEFFGGKGLQLSKVGGDLHRIKYVEDQLQEVEIRELKTFKRETKSLKRLDGKECTGISLEGHNQIKRTKISRKRRRKGDGISDEGDMVSTRTTKNVKTWLLEKEEEEDSRGLMGNNYLKGVEQEIVFGDNLVEVADHNRPKSFP